MHLPSLRRRIDSELVGERVTQSPKHGERTVRVPGGLVSGHQQTVRRLVEAVGFHRDVGDPAGSLRVTRTQRGLGGDMTRATSKCVELRPGIPRPLNVRLVG